MKRFQYLILIFCCSANVKAQQLLPIQHDTTFHNYEFIINGVLDYGTSSINNDFSRKLLFGGAITDDIKDNSFANHKGINRFGFDLSSEAEFRNFKINLFGKDNWGLLVKGGYYNYFSAIYSKDLFGLAFYGNEQYLGENVNFSGSRFSTMTFQKLGFGIIDKKSKSNVTLNFYSISNYVEGTVRDGILFQTEEGDSLSLTLDGELEYTSENTFIKGFGAGIDLDFRIPVIIRKEKVSYIQFLAKNMGIAHVFSDVTHYSVDSIYTYDGLSFDQIYGDQSIFNNKFSVLDTLGIDSTTTTKTRFLPGFIQAGKIIDEYSTTKLQSFFGVRIYPSIGYAPMVYAGVQCKTTKWLDLGLNVSYGGYSAFKGGLYAQFKLKNLALGIASENLYGLFSKNAKGESFVLRLRYIL